MQFKYHFVWIDWRYAVPYILGDENGKMILLSQNEKSKLFLKGLFNKFEAKIWLKSILILALQYGRF